MVLSESVAQRVAEGGPGCARDLKVHRLTETDQQVLASVTFSTTDASDRSGCPDRTPVAAMLPAAAPYGQRAIVLNSGRSPWIRAGDGYRPCHPILGCDPPADRCDERWVKTATG